MLGEDLDARRLAVRRIWLEGVEGLIMARIVKDVFVLVALELITYGLLFSGL